MMRRIKKLKENPMQKEAFEFYYSLGKERKLATVAKQFGKACITVDLWSCRFNWVERVQKREVEEHKKARMRMEKKMESIKDKHQKIIDKLLEDYEKNLEEGIAAKIKSIFDYKEIAKLDLLLSGEATEREEQKIVFEDVEGRTDIDDDDDDIGDKKVINFPQG